MWRLKMIVTTQSKHINCEIDNIMEFAFERLHDLTNFMADAECSVRGKAVFEVWYEEGEQE